MAVMTFAEMKRNNMLIGKKYYGIVFNVIFVEGIYILEVDFDQPNDSIEDSWIVSSIYSMKFINGNVEFNDEDMYKHNFTIYEKFFEDNRYFADSKEELWRHVSSLPLICPRRKDEKTLGYKLVKLSKKADEKDYGIAFLEIPYDAERTNPYFGRKCRADKVYVTKILALRKYCGGDKPFNKVEVKAAYSPFRYVDQIVYEPNKMVCSKYDSSRLRECTKGIHFYSTLKEVLDLYECLMDEG